MEKTYISTGAGTASRRGEREAHRFLLPEKMVVARKGKGFLPLKKKEKAERGARRKEAR